MCEVVEREQRDQTSLAIIRAGTVHDLVIEAEPKGWDPEKEAVINQPSLFAPDKTTLKPVPYKFKYRFTCARATCRGHEQSIIDWELAQAYFKWHSGSDKEVLEKIRHKWLDEICGSGRDTFFFVGNIHLYPRSFMVLGTFWPPKDEQESQLNLGL
jgi:hypothetical protein